MLMTDRRRLECQRVADLARQVLAELFAVHSGEPPRAVRVYRETDAVMLLLRFDPRIAATGADAGLEAQMDVSLMAMFELLIEVASPRSGCEIVPGNLSVCASSGLAVFAMRVAAEEAGRPCYRLAEGRRRGGLPSEGSRLAI
jgi:hypothetical protein